MTAEYRILGPLAVEAGGRPVGVTAGRDRVVLVMLLLHANRIVSAGELVEAVWGTEPPATARGQLQSCVSRLRRLLPDGAIQTDPAGYRIAVGPDELDAAIFARLVNQARAAQDRDGYRRALALWRGAACAELEAPAIRQAAAALDERYALAVEDWADLELAAGNERALAGELGVFVERFPLRERLRGQLMLALARSGRQADALAEFRRARDLLADELGIEPGEELQKRHREVLNGETATEVRASGQVRCLPRTVGDFTGRTEQVDRLLAGDKPVVVIDGMAGSGKTTLALHVAGLIGNRYPDAHLYVDLHGHSDQDPVDPAAALLTLLRQLGLAVRDIPADPVERLGRWRTELSHRRALVVLDNVATSAQVADLLPAGPGSLALVTSRRRLAGLDGARVESLPVLTPGEAITLFARIAGDRVHEEPEAAAEVVRRCGLLPLAIRLAGSRLAHRRGWRVADLLRRLGEAALPELAAEERSVAGAFTLTYRQLPDSPRRLFRLLGTYPAADFDTPAAAALAGVPLDRVGDDLDVLIDVHLVDEPERGVFRLHDLLREYAGTLAADLPAHVRKSALAAVLDLQLHAAAAAAAPNHRPHLEADLESPLPERPDLLAALGDPAARMERERPHLAGYVEAAAAIGRLDLAWKIPRAAWSWLYYRSYVDDVRDLHLLAMRRLDGSGDTRALAALANYLASAYNRTAEFATASEYVRLAIRLRGELGDTQAQAVGYGNLAAVHESAGEYHRAIEAAQAGRRLMRTPISSLLAAIHEAYSRLGEPAEATRYARLRLIVALDQDDRTWIAMSLLNLQRLKVLSGTRTPEAAHRHLDTLAPVLIRARYLVGIAELRDLRAGLFRAQGRFAEALAEHRAALEIAAETQDGGSITEFRCGHAKTLRLAGDVAGAAAEYRRALDAAREARLPYSTARAEAGLATCLDPDDPEAMRRRERARDLFHRMGITTINRGPEDVERGWSGDD